MLRWILILAIALCAPLAGALERQIIGSEQDHSSDGGEKGDCQHFYHTTFTSFPARVEDQEQREIALTGAEPQLRIDSSQEGGIAIRGWSRPSARLTICRFAAAASREQALRVLSGISISHANNHIEAAGPQIDQTQAWWVNMTLYVPRGTFVDVRAKGGGVNIRNVTGRIKAFSTSGGISVVQSTGKFVLSSETGGITLDRVSGRAEAFSRSGSIALKVSAAAKPNVEARTAAAHILCALKDCNTGLGKWAANRRALTLGTAPPDFRLTTSGSPIMIGAVPN
jgi:hypothetical protein